MTEPPSPASIPQNTVPNSHVPLEIDVEQVTRTRRAEILIVLTATGLLLMTVAIVPHLLTAQSRDAVINATPITIRSPITGTLQSLPVKAGLELRRGEELAMIRNTRIGRDELVRLRSELRAAQSRQADLHRQEFAQAQLVAVLQRDAERQQALEIRRNRQDLMQSMADLQRAKAELAFAEREASRIGMLFRTGAVAANLADRANTTVQQRRRELASLEARVASGRTELEASTQNLVLRNNRSGSDPVVRLQDARRTLQALQGDSGTQDQRVVGLERQLATAREQWETQHLSVLRSPRRAVVWELQAQAGDLLNALQPVMKLIDCGNRWVTTNVAENDLNRLHIGTAARIELVGKKLSLKGEVQSIRSGIGRLRLGEDPLVPIPINLVRESEVRVRILNDIPAPPLRFCYVGYTGRVSFEP